MFEDEVIDSSNLNGKKGYARSWQWPYLTIRKLMNLFIEVIS